MQAEAVLVSIVLALPFLAVAAIVAFGIWNITAATLKRQWIRAAAGAAIAAAPFVWLSAMKTSIDHGAAARNAFVANLPRRPVSAIRPRLLQANPGIADADAAALLDSGLFDEVAAWDARDSWIWKYSGPGRPPHRVARPVHTVTWYRPVRTPTCIQRARRYILDTIAAGPIQLRARQYPLAVFFDAPSCLSKSESEERDVVLKQDAVIFESGGNTTYEEQVVRENVFEVHERSRGVDGFIDYQELPYQANSSESGIFVERKVIEADIDGLAVLLKALRVSPADLGK